MQFERPIPGESLTRPPKEAPFERPPEVSDPMEALDIHIENLQKDGVAEDIVFFIEEGLDIQTLVEGILRSAVMEGIHTIDVSLIIAPVLHEHIKSYAVLADIEFDEGFEDPDRDKALSYERDTMRARKLLRKMSGDKKEKPIINVREDVQEEETEVETTDIAPTSMGLMARI